MITDDDIASATRALQLPSRTDDELAGSLAHHDAIDRFASRVIAEAVRREMARRGINTSKETTR